MYEALKSLGRETELAVYPSEYDRLEHSLSWYAHYVKADGTPPQPAAKAN